MAQLNKRIGGRKENLREMLLTAGVGEFNATMSIPYMYFLPRTCDPYAQGVIQIVEGLQNLLTARHLSVPIDGWMGPATAAAVERFSGPDWRDKSWMQIYGDVLRGQLAPGIDPDPVAPELNGYTEETGLGFVGDLISNPLVLVAGGAVAYFLFGDKLRLRGNPARRRRARRRN